MDLTSVLKNMFRDSIRMHIGGEPTGRSRFGGCPDVPDGFAWPTFFTATFDDFREKDHSLGFLLQIDCAELAAAGISSLLPDHGLLSFFYEMESQRWGYDPDDAGCCRVFWFEDTEKLHPADFPGDLGIDFRFPPLGIRFSAEASLPDSADFALTHPEPFDWENYAETLARLGAKPDSPQSKLLGWPNILQNNMTNECELVSRGHDLGGTWETVSEEERAKVSRHSIDEWQLLLQLDTVEDGDFQLVFGDCGRIYFYIRRSDLIKGRFDRVWLLLQC